VTLVAVARSKFAVGVASSEDDWRAPPGDPRNCRAHKGGVGVRADSEVYDLRNALDLEHKTDAHLYAYVMRDQRGAPLQRQPRLNKSALSWVRSLGFTVWIECLFADVDTPGHVPWTDELRAVAIEQDRRLATAGVYYSANGRRIVQPLEHALEIDDTGEAEARIGTWLASLHDLGIHADRLTDWTRCFRLPHVRRDGRFSRSVRIDLSRMVPIEAPEPSAPERRRARNRARFDLSVAADVGGTPLAKAFAAAGMLGPSLGRGKAAIVCPFAGGHSMGREYDSSTVLFGPTSRAPLGWVWCSHASCADRSQEEFFEALPDAARALIPSRSEQNFYGVQSAAAHRTVPHAEARETLERAFRRAPDGLSVVIAGCGTGKTEAAIAIAHERASRKLDALRAPPHSKTSISVPTTKLSREVADRVRAKGIAVRRIFGPLSVKRDDGSYECRIHACASAFAKGGLSVPWELCEGRGKQPCTYADTCAARGGVEGPDNARIVVGPHKLLARLSDDAGSTGMLVIDEPPPLLSHEVLTSEHLVDCARDLERYFEPRYAAALGVSLHALAQWILTAPLDAPCALHDGVAHVDPARLEIALRATGTETAIEAAREAFEPLPEGQRRISLAPPVTRTSAGIARAALYVARAIGEASRVARLVQTSLAADPTQTRARVEERAGRRVLVLTVADMQLREALQRNGQVVVADAGGRLHLPIYKIVVGYEPHLAEAHAADGVEVERVHIVRRASRAGWFRNGQLHVDGSVVRALELAVDWLNERPFENAAMITFLPLELAIRAAWGEDVRAAWLQREQDPAALEEAASRLRPALRRLAKRLDLGHYLGVRGLDHWKDHDALVTIGDPWPQLTDARWEADFLRLKEGWESRLTDAARQELEQAHGRLRTVHRKTPCRALHVGALRPGGWSQCEEREDAGGRPKRLRKAEAEAVVREHGSVAAAARALGIHRSTLIAARKAS
jgi:hypothetical protein